MEFLTYLSFPSNKLQIMFVKYAVHLPPTFPLGLLVSLLPTQEIQTPRKICDFLKAKNIQNLIEIEYILPRVLHLNLLILLVLSDFNSIIFHFQQRISQNFGLMEIFLSLIDSNVEYLFLKVIFSHLFRT